MIGALLLVAVVVLLALTMRKPRKRRPVVYLSGGPQRVLSAADLRRAVGALPRERREAFRAWSQSVWAALRMGERG